MSGRQQRVLSCHRHRVSTRVVGLDFAVRTAKGPTLVEQNGRTA